MFFHRSVFGLLTLGSCSIMLGLTACTRTNHSDKASVQPAAVAERPPPVEDDSDDDVDGMRMFGREGEAADLVFEGKAATNLSQRTMPSEGADFDPAIDPSGKLMVYASTRHTKNSHLYLKTISGATITQITDGVGSDAQPVFSPDGARIAFTSDRGGSWDIWVIGADGRNPVQVTNGIMPELHPSWSPDGKRLVYSRINTKENSGELWIADLTNPGVRKFLGEGLFPTWSPKGDKIAYQRAKSRGSRWFSIWTIDINNDEVMFPTEIAGSENAAFITPAWSKDGTQLAFSIIQDSAAQVNATTDANNPLAFMPGAHIGTVHIDGRGLQRITEGNGRHYSPVWSSDGNVYFSYRSDDSETIWSVQPFRGDMMNEPPSAVTSSNRRAAQAVEVSDE